MTTTDAYHLLFENSPALHALVGPGRILIDVNKAFADNLRYAKQELVGRDLTDFVAEEERETARVHLEKALGSESIPQRDWQMLTKDGGRRVFRSSGKKPDEKIRTPDNSIIVVLLDVTDLRESLDRERQEREALFYSAKMVSLGVLVSGVAHEINNPNGLILLSVDNLGLLWNDLETQLRDRKDAGSLRVAGMSFEDAGEKVARLLSNIRGGSQKIRGYVGRLNELTQSSQADNKQVCDLNEIVVSALKSFEEKIKKATNRFSSVSTDQPCLIRADFQQIEELIGRLLVNACRSLTHKEQEIRVEVSSGASGACVELQVEDGGRGLPEEILGKVTDFAAEASEPGQGLIASKRIASDHGGTLEWLSTEGKGTRAILRLPRHYPPFKRQGD